MVAARASLINEGSVIACLAFSLWLAEREPWEMPVLVRENQNPGAIGGVLGADRQKHAVEELTLGQRDGADHAYLDHPIIARAAFRAAVEQYPRSPIRLCNWT